MPARPRAGISSSRWGARPGHLALGIGKAAGATITLITEEFTARPIRLKTIVDTLVASIIKRQSLGRPDGVAVIAEGVSLAIDPQDFAESVERGARRARSHPAGGGEPRGDPEDPRAARASKELGLKTTIAEKNIGYELRCADPIPFDIEYTRDLGYCAAKFLIEGGGAAMISLQGGQFVPVPFAQMLDREDRTDARPARGHQLDALRDRASLHGPAAEGRLRYARRTRPPRDGRQTPARGVPPPVRAARRHRAAAAHAAVSHLLSVIGYLLFEMLIGD